MGLQKAFSGHFVVNNWFGIVEFLILRYPSAQIPMVFVKFFDLLLGVKDAEIRGCIDSATSHPLPITHIARKLKIK